MVAFNCVALLLAASYASAFELYPRQSITEIDGIHIYLDPKVMPPTCPCTVATTLNACTTAECVCTATNLQDSVTCVKCIMSLAPGVLTTATAQQAIDLTISECSAQGIDLQAIKLEESTANSTASATDSDSATATSPATSATASAGSGGNGAARSSGSLLGYIACLGALLTTATLFV